jgi:hypothetical protein
VALWVSEERLQPASRAIHTPRGNQFSKNLILVRQLVLCEVAAFGIHFFPPAVVQVVAMLVANLLASSTPIASRTPPWLASGRGFRGPQACNIYILVEILRPLLRVAARQEHRFHRGARITQY